MHAIQTNRNKENSIPSCKLAVQNRVFSIFWQATLNLNFSDRFVQPLQIARSRTESGASDFSDHARSVRGPSGLTGRRSVSRPATFVPVLRNNESTRAKPLTGPAMPAINSDTTIFRTITAVSDFFRRATNAGQPFPFPTAKTTIGWERTVGFGRRARKTRRSACRGPSRAGQLRVSPGHS